MKLTNEVNNLLKIVSKLSFFLITIMFFLISGCSTSTVIDEQKSSRIKLNLEFKEKIVVMGRRHGNSYETEPNFINCISSNIAGTGKLSVMKEQQFLDKFYPWFEPRLAPLSLESMKKTLNEPAINRQVQNLGIRYMVWVDGSTETTKESGSITCGMSASGGCFGFKSWDKTSSYEATVWDLKNLTEKGKVKVDSKGSSYLIGVGPPIPLIAQVQGVACDGISDRLGGFFLNK